MAVGLSPTLLANNWLNMLRGVAFTAPVAQYIEEHIGDPGVNGTTNPGLVTGRQVLTYGAAAAGVLTLSNTPTFTQTGTETISHIAVWDAVTIGNFLYSAVLTTPKAVVATDTLTFTTLTVSITPLAA